MTITLIVIMCCSASFVIGAAFGSAVARNTCIELRDALVERQAQLWRAERRKSNPDMPALRVVKGGGR